MTNKKNDNKKNLIITVVAFFGIVAVCLLLYVFHALKKYKIANFNVFVSVLLSVSYKFVCEKVLSKGSKGR